MGILVEEKYEENGESWEWTALFGGLCVVFMLTDETLAREENEGLPLLNDCFTLVSFLSFWLSPYPFGKDIVYNVKRLFRLNLINWTFYKVIKILISCLIYLMPAWALNLSQVTHTIKYKIKILKFH